MKKTVVFSTVVCLIISGFASADTFGTGANQFEIDFVPISGSTNPTSGYGIVNNDYRMGTYEITNDQWNKFVSSVGSTVTGSPSDAYDASPYFTGTKVPTNNISWHEAAQFVNWLNTSEGHHAAYNFTGTQGTSNYTFDVWDVTDAAGGTNLYRHKDAYYFLPTEDEWVKTAYWNGTSLQTDATKAGESLHQGDGTSGSGWNYWDNGAAATDPPGPWDVGSGSEELNGTHDMMGNVWELIESPFNPEEFLVDSDRCFRGGMFNGHSGYFESSFRANRNPIYENLNVGFRVASVPEPATLSLLAVGGLLLHKRK